MHLNYIDKILAKTFLYNELPELHWNVEFVKSAIKTNSQEQIDWLVLLG